MGPTEQLSHILPACTALVDRIQVMQMNDPTPCEKFTVHDVLDHMMVLGGTFTYLFRGEEVPELTPPGVYGWVPSKEFREVMDDLFGAITSPGALERTIESPMGTMDGETFARVVAFDGLVHAWDLAVATGRPLRVDPDVVSAVHDFARRALTDDLRATGMFAPATEPPADASPIESLAAHSGRSVEPRWRPAPNALHRDKATLPIKIDVPGAVARQVLAFGDATGYGEMAGEYFSLGAGTDIAPLLRGLHDDVCHAPHWGYMISGRLVVSFVDGTEATCCGGEIFYWAPGHSVRVLDDAEVILFSPQAEHLAVLDHMLDVMATA